MKFHPYFCPDTLTNTYLIGSQEGGPAVLVDPPNLDLGLLELIERRRYDVRWILVTRAQTASAAGLRTLLKVYPAQVLARQARIADREATVIRPGAPLVLEDFHFEVLAFPELAGDAVAYKLGPWLFVGDLLSAGDLGPVANSYARSNLITALRDRLYSLPDEVVVFPRSGPPSRIRSERMFHLYSEESQGASTLQPTDFGER